MEQNRNKLIRCNHHTVGLQRWICEEEFEKTPKKKY